MEVGVQFLIVLGSGVALLGLAFIIWIAVAKQRHYGTPNWPHVQGEVTASRVVPFSRETAHGRDHTYTTLLEYHYMVGGLPYSSKNRDFLPDAASTTRDLLKATRVVSRYPEGSSVRVYYNPANPKQAALEVPKPVAHNAVLFYGITNLVAGIIIAVLGIVLLS
jgi:hypothetical protein